MSSNSTSDAVAEVQALLDLPAPDLVVNAVHHVLRTLNAESSEDSEGSEQSEGPRELAARIAAIIERHEGRPLDQLGAPISAIYTGQLAQAAQRATLTRVSSAKASMARELLEGLRRQGS